MIATLVLLVGGAVGAVARFHLDGFIQDHTHGALPAGTTIVNVSGAFVLGVIVGLSTRHVLGSNVELALGTGFCGAFTTFSSLMFESTRLAQDGAVAAAVRTLALNVVCGSVAAAVGLLIAGGL